MCVLQDRTDQAFKAMEKEKGSRKRKGDQEDWREGAGGREGQGETRRRRTR